MSKSAVGTTENLPRAQGLANAAFAQLASQTIFGNAKLRLSKIWTSAPSNAELRDFFARLLLAASNLEDILLPSVPHLFATKEQKDQTKIGAQATRTFLLLPM